MTNDDAPGLCEGSVVVAVTSEGSDLVPVPRFFQEKVTLD